MKNLMAITLILSLISSLAGAQGTSRSRMQKKAPPTYNYDPEAFMSDVRPFYMLKGFNMGFEFMDTSSYERDTKYKLTGEVEKGVRTDAARDAKYLGIKMGYKEVPRGGMGFDLNLSVLKSERRPEGTPDVTHLLPTANFIFAAPEYVYGALGLNSDFIVGDENATYSPRIGYQVGLGAVIGEKCNLEIFYNWIKTGVDSDSTQSEIRTTATNARLLYAF